MDRRLVLASVVAFGVPLVLSRPARASQRGSVDDVTTTEVQVKPCKAAKDSPDKVETLQVQSKTMKVPKADAEAVETTALVSREMKVPIPAFEGIPPIAKKPPAEDEDTVDDAAKQAEQDQGAKGGGAGAEGDAMFRAEQKALSQGRSPAEAQDVGEAARQRVRDDYARVADGGSLAPPPPATPAASPSKGEDLPEVLEAPAQEATPPEEAAPQGPEVIDVSPQQ